ncbi:aldo/keto reductase [Candidatus Woesearchaeota archaeon]|nr:MAG: aldo/keto reductase [archaeon GW2011_AR4]MBS3129533.1 aldo/keto reductase [Candidatus Woesearchaeota archaeon]HIH37501.1 aldo/keto reductase [Candidatus Woesearchaeota archaeon]HIJ03244.1 aldo/keto reductase [Candidatus Woesearchaeota archaeon]
METIKLSSGYSIPILGLGTWQLKGQRCTEIVKNAIEEGYTHIDTAWIYENQEEIAPAIAEHERKKLFITSKLWRDQLSYSDVLEQCDETLSQLGIDYLDLYLIHWPNKDIPMEETFNALAKLATDGKVKSIGVSNFTITHLKKALGISKIPITMNQVEYHPYLNQEDLLAYCNDNNITLTAYSPLGRGIVLKDRVILAIAERKKKTPAQVALRWLIQKGIIVIPKTTREERLPENLLALDITLTAEEMKQIDTLNRNERIVHPGFAEF